MKLFKRKSDDYVDLDSHLSKHEKKIKSMSNYKASEDGTVDLTGHLPEGNTDSVKSESNNVSSSGGGFFGGFFGGTSSSDIQTVGQSDDQTTEPSDARKKKISEVIRTLTNRLEEQDNEIYKLKQRLEVLERKSRIDY